MKILIAADIFPPQIGGPATYAKTLISELPKHEVEVKLVSLNPNGEHISHITYHPSASLRAGSSHANKIVRYLEYLWLLYKHSSNVDVIYAMGPVNAGLPALIVSFLRRKKFVVKVVGDYAWEQGMQRFGVTDLMDDFQNKRYKWNVELLRRIESIVVHSADQIVVPSNYLKTIVTGWRANEQKVRVIYNAVEIKSVVPISKSADEQWIVSVGRLARWKGIDALIECMPDIRKECPHARLKIIGDGPELENLKLAVNNLGLESYVELLGNLSREKTLAYIRSSDVFILNSGYEGLSHALLEALSFGGSVLASNVGGNTELGLEKENLFEYNNTHEIKEKIVQFLRSGNSGRVSHEHVFFDQFKLETMITKTKEVLESV